MINKDIVKKKISNILAYIKELEPILEIDTGVLLNEENYRDLRALERDFQLIVDTMIEINSHIIKQNGYAVAETYYNTFVIMGKNNILPIDFSFSVANIVGLRNKIVHKYDVIDLKKFINDIKENSCQFGEYVKYIMEYLEKA